MSTMASFPALARRAAALAALAGLLAQAALPVAHSWRVGAEETAYHASVHADAPGTGLCGEHQRGHRHHDDADCLVCPLFSAARLSPGPTALAVSPVFGAALLQRSAVAFVSAHRAAPDARAPPAGLSA